ncbi:hypothetical protein H4219_002990 [Mycoemilia scoparia]|uniref:Uncharacterized protein n=1 Tax=Mycoemilia scoparia TaxID=417184 RepID=A0A9W7ZW27_9FUNG|nr:hypothetical protein H4219_002990 [Mycoemilia scoparia]
MYGLDASTDRQGTSRSSCDAGTVKLSKDDGGVVADRDLQERQSSLNTDALHQSQLNRAQASSPSLAPSLVPMSASSTLPASSTREAHLGEGDAGLTAPKSQKIHTHHYSQGQQYVQDGSAHAQEMFLQRPPGHPSSAASIFSTTNCAPFHPPRPALASVHSAYDYHQPKARSARLSPVDSAVGIDGTPTVGSVNTCNRNDNGENGGGSSRSSRSGGGAGGDVSADNKKAQSAFLDSRLTIHTSLQSLQLSAPSSVLGSPASRSAHTDTQPMSTGSLFHSHALHHHRSFNSSHTDRYYPFLRQEQSVISSSGAAWYSLPSLSDTTNALGSGINSSGSSRGGYQHHRALAFGSQLSAHPGASAGPSRSILGSSSNTQAYPHSQQQQQQQHSLHFPSSENIGSAVGFGDKQQVLFSNTTGQQRRFYPQARAPGYLHQHCLPSTTTAPGLATTNQGGATISAPLSGSISKTTHPPPPPPPSAFSLNIRSATSKANTNTQHGNSSSGALSMPPRNTTPSSSMSAHPSSKYSQQTGNISWLQWYHISKSLNPQTFDRDVSKASRGVIGL